MQKLSVLSWWNSSNGTKKCTVLQFSKESGTKASRCDTYWQNYEERFSELSPNLFELPISILTLLHPPKSEDGDGQLSRVAFKINDFLWNPHFRYYVCIYCFEYISLIFNILDFTKTCLRLVQHWSQLWPIEMKMV